MKKTVKDINVQGKRAIVRCDFNVPMKEGVITDDIRIVSALPTVKYLMEQGAKVILMSHMGRPDGEGGDAPEGFEGIESPGVGDGPGGMNNPGGANGAGGPGPGGPGM